MSRKNGPISSGEGGAGAWIAIGTMVRLFLFVMDLPSVITFRERLDPPVVVQALLNAHLPIPQEHILWWVMSDYMDWKDVNADQRGIDGATLLHLAAKSGKLEVVRRLVLILEET